MYIFEKFLRDQTRQDGQSEREMQQCQQLTFLRDVAGEKDITRSLTRGREVVIAIMGIEGLTCLIDGQSALHQKYGLKGELRIILLI